VGEIHVAGVGVTPGYLRQPDLTAERYLPNPFGAGAMYRTGDLGLVLDDGRLVCLGRLDNQVKVNGHRIELGEIESVLLRHRSISSAAAGVVTDSGGRARLVAHLVADDGVLPDDLRAHMAEYLPRHMIPGHYELVEAFPLTVSGKVDRNALPAPRLIEATTAMVEPRNELEAEIASIWADQLGMDAISVVDDVFDLGANSLFAIRASVLVSDRFEVELLLRDMFEDSTVEGMARTVAVRMLGRSASAEDGEHRIEMEF
ncbi:MAG: non-ribosomal peptide synthetase, partial [Actinomycetota bacterium]